MMPALTTMIRLSSFGTIGAVGSLNQGTQAANGYSTGFLSLRGSAGDAIVNAASNLRTRSAKKGINGLNTCTA
jgi:hypothetical protein